MTSARHGRLTVTRATPGTLPRVPFARLHKAIMGADYTLDIIFIGTKKAEEMHIDWKHKDGPANILSFPLDAQNGEIYISIAQARSEYKKFDLSYLGYLTFLIIHGMLHLKGMTHGSTMEKHERQWMKHFKVS
jgi:rRNA maturation RNase YbeY